AIDASRTYSNFGPLVRSLEERLAAHFGVRKEMITTTANATQGLTLALMTMGARPGTLCVMPAWTFIASAHAALAAGLTPYFVDVDPHTWALNPAEIEKLIARAPAPVGAIMPVVPFGQPIDGAAWDRFREGAGLPVVIDAAAGFDSLVVCNTPSVVSLHATKVIGVGEGGFVITKDERLIHGIRARANFGFSASRSSIAVAMNAKLSEYHAAIGHAALDEWADARADWLKVSAAYRRMLPQSNRIQYQEGFGVDWIASTCLMRLPESDAAETESALAAAGVETRRWWGDGAHRHPATETFPRGPLPVTEMLARSTISVPFYRDLDLPQIQTVTGAIQSILPAS
ncbi:MAG TPA: aminotransferase class I/II-fold pyridoxal phosphate-dependent enzyme, partial [Sphingomicrobium sp.]|nr:aminotransferase class I/II-fold pyridoxal phosphate-dependent enzyme [Sphingomicrobium sp.]